MQYFPHVDGLRAIAVLSVLFFHFEFELFQGGYIGVDVFFVISGFLITKLIANEITNTGSFSFSRFYIRRARRLFPAFFVTLFISAVVASFIFTSSYLEAFGRELIASTLSLSNILFWTQSGYFDNVSETKALLHTWSLSVEEQFYLFWPAFLYFVYKKFSRLFIPLVFLSVFSASLFLNVYALENEISWFKNQDSAVFFLMPFRIHEFMLGACSFWLTNKFKPSQIAHELLFVAGFCLIFYSIFSFEKDLAFPHFYALIPCIGTALIIVAHQSIFCSLLLKQKLMIWIGMISYSLYLTHWPIIVFYKFYQLYDLSIFEKLALLFLTFVLSCLLYYKIEKRFRKNSVDIRQQETQQPFLRYLFVSVLLGSILGAVYIQSNGLEGYKQELFTSSQIQQGKVDRFSFSNKACKLVDFSSQNCFVNRPLQILFYGNSHEVDGYNSFHHILKNNDSLNMTIFGSTNKCEIKFDSTRGIISEIEKFECNDRAAELNRINFIQSLDVLIYSALLPFAKNKVEDWKILSYLQSINPNLKIIVLGTYFSTVKKCAEIANKYNSIEVCSLPESIQYAGNLDYKKVVKQATEFNVEFTFFDKFKLLCENSTAFETCKTSISGVPLFYDRHHLSLEFAQYLGELYFDAYEAELNSMGLHSGLKN